jgi:hypothetical protein
VAPTGAKVVPLRNAPMTVRIEALALIPQIFARLTYWSLKEMPRSKRRHNN